MNNEIKNSKNDINEIIQSYKNLRSDLEIFYNKYNEIIENLDINNIKQFCKEYQPLQKKSQELKNKICKCNNQNIPTDLIMFSSNIPSKNEIKQRLNQINNLITFIDNLNNSFLILYV